MNNWIYNQEVFKKSTTGKTSHVFLFDVKLRVFLIIHYEYLSLLRVIFPNYLLQIFIPYKESVVGKLAFNVTPIMCIGGNPQ